MIDPSSMYPPPSTYKKQDGSSRFCFMTFVMRNDSFIPGALVFAFALRQMHTQADLLCMVTKEITSQARQALEMIFDNVLDVEEVFVYHDRRQERQDRPYLFTRFQSLLVGTDGPFGLQYEKVVLADADVLPLASYDHLFTLASPAGVINESKANCIQANQEGIYFNPFSGSVSGKWIWHEIYDPVCPHGTKIPKFITDRVKTDQNNMGVNSSLWVISPSAHIYNKIITELSVPEIRVLVSSQFNWPEMQFATLFWSGEWTNIDLRFSSFNGYPSLDILCGTHFAGYKPWNFKEMGTISRFGRFPDYKLWHLRFKEMMCNFPTLRKYPKLARLEQNISNLIIHFPQ
jgi:alpha-N-acetylglucosamine transferase